MWIYLFNVVFFCIIFGTKWNECEIDYILSDIRWVNIYKRVNIQVLIVLDDNYMYLLNSIICSKNKMLSSHVN